MIEYRKKHSAEESATAIRRWYDEHDSILAAAIEEGQQLKNLRNANMSNGYEMCQEGGDYERCEKRRRSEVRGAMYDRNKIQEDGLLTARLQQTFMRIRNGLNTRGRKLSVVQNSECERSRELLVWGANARASLEARTLQL